MGSGHYSDQHKKKFLVINYNSVGRLVCVKYTDDDVEQDKIWRTFWYRY